MVARDRIELSTLRFSVQENEATGGSRTPLPPVFIGVLAHSTPPQPASSRYRLSAICQPISSCRKVLFGLHSRFPVSRPATSVRHGDDQDAVRFDSIDDAE